MQETLISKEQISAIIASIPKNGQFGKPDILKITQSIEHEEEITNALQTYGMKLGFCQWDEGNQSFILTAEYMNYNRKEPNIELLNAISDALALQIARIDPSEVRSIKENKANIAGIIVLTLFLLSFTIYKTYVNFFS